LALMILAYGGKRGTGTRKSVVTTVVGRQKKKSGRKKEGEVALHVFDYLRFVRYCLEKREGKREGATIFRYTLAPSRGEERKKKKTRLREGKKGKKGKKKKGGGLKRAITVPSSWKEKKGGEKRGMSDP